MGRVGWCDNGGAGHRDSRPGQGGGDGAHVVETVLATGVPQCDSFYYCFEATLTRRLNPWSIAAGSGPGELLRAGQDPAGGERCFCRAIHIAQKQSAKLFELRAPTSLARLWCEEGKRDAAHDLLGPICGWFTEGFDTPVQKETKALLD